MVLPDRGTNKGIPLWHSHKEIMTQCNEGGDNNIIVSANGRDYPIRTCATCGYQIKCQDKQVLKFV